MRKQNTLKRSVEFKGIGLHSGKKTSIILKPAPEDTGIVFVSSLSGSKQFIPFQLENVTDTRNNITVSNGRAIIKTVEHLTGTLYGLKIDNCIVECDSTEIPIMDGSCSYFIDEIIQAGTVRQIKNREEMHILNPVWMTIDDKFIIALPYEKLKLNYTISFPNSPIGTQTFQMEYSKNKFIENLGRARTFGFIEDMDYYQEMGLVLGGGMENVHVFSKKGRTNLNESRYDDEPVRHKMLDLLGGLAILNKDIKGFIISFKGGHTLDIKFAQKLLDISSHKIPYTQESLRESIDQYYYHYLSDILKEEMPS